MEDTEPEGPGGTPESVLYYKMPDGSVTEIRYTGATPVLPEGAILLSQQEYEAELAALQAAQEAEHAAQVAAECAAAKQAYDLLRSLGMSDEAARSVSRWSPENCPPAP